MPSFNLVDQPWIPCVPLPSGSPALRGLRATLMRAHELRSMSDNSPLVYVALHRLLLAVLHRLYGPRTLAEWRALRQAGQFDAAQINAYLDQWRPRFDLFDAEHPFYQVPRMDGANTISVAKLALEMASGNNVTLFDHSTGSTAAFTPAETARYLVAFQAFAVGGGVSTPFNLSDAPLARDYTVLVRGESLFETLVLNMLPYNEDRPLPRLGADLPWWERDTHTVPDKAGTYPTGYLEYLTWQSRRVHLIYDETAGVVRECQVRQNFKLAPAYSDRDPFKAYRLVEKAGWLPRRLSEERAVWRDSHALVEVAGEGGRRPAVFDWLATAEPTGLGRQRHTARAYAFDVLGYRTDGAQAKIVLWRHERLPLPLDYLTVKALRDSLRDAITLAEEVSALFTRGFGGGPKQKPYPRPMRVLAEALLAGISDRRPDGGDIERQVNHFGAERAYWSALEVPFRRFMVDLAAEQADLPQWARTVESVARQTFVSVMRSLDTSARSLRAAALAERSFGWQLEECVSRYAIASDGSH